MLSEEGLLTEKRIFSRIGLILFMILISNMALGLAISALSPVIFPEPSIGSWSYYALTLLPNYLIVMPLAALMLYKIPSKSIEQKSLKPGQLAIVFMICYSIVGTGNAAAKILSFAISAITQKGVTDLVANLIIESDIWANLIVIAILAPIIEELFYRKLMIERLSRYGEKVAVITSGLIFGLVHANISQFFYAFGLGLAFGYIFIKTGKIRYTIALHIIINLIGSVLAPALLNSESLILISLFSIPVLGIVISGIVLFFVYKKRISFRQGEIVLPQEKWKATVFLNTGMVFFFAVCAVIFILNTFFVLI